MSALETLPLPLDAMGGADARGLDEFRVSEPVVIHSLLKQMADGNVMVNLSTPEGHGYVCTVWALDPGRGLLCLSANAGDPKLQSLLDSREVVAVAYLDSIKLQFDLHDLVLVHSGNASALNAGFPQLLYRFQRRSAFRVRTPANAGPTARLRLPAQPQSTLSLRVIASRSPGTAESGRRW